MSTDPVSSALQLGLDEWLAADDRLCVAFSGGIDSTVLLHALAQLLPPSRFRAVHVDHGLHPDSASWAEFCRSSCAQLSVPFELKAVQVDTAAGGGPEARARVARYAALRAELRPGEWLVTAHHQQDQAETFLLQLMRGAGPVGLASMSLCGERDGTVYFRPLLTVNPTAIHAYALAAGLEWLEDPSNQDLGFDRNFLRHEVLPLLQARWPAAAQVMARSARLCAQAADSIAALARADLQGMLQGNRLNLERFARLPGQRQSEALRAGLQQLKLPVPSELQLQLAIRQLLNAREDAQPQLQWPGVGIRRYRNTAWLYTEQDNAQFDQAAPGGVDWQYTQPLQLGPAAGVVEGVETTGAGIGLRHLQAGLQVQFRRGGERLRVAADGPRRSLKNLLQENDVVPWMRKHIPVFYSGDRLLAVGDMWVDVDVAALEGEPGVSVNWHSHGAFK